MSKEIHVQKNGPYLIKGGVRLVHEVLTHHEDDHYTWEQRQVLLEEDEKKQYILCRCGRSNNMPYCDGEHRRPDAAGRVFDGEEEADHDDFVDRAGVFEGTDFTLLDDIDLCSQGRFCHTPHGKIWTLLEHEDPKVRQRALQGIDECPAGRLVAMVDGEMREPTLVAEISVTEDPQKEVSGPLYVRGGIPVFDAEGNAYEVRNRQALCRCGNSHNMPYCDARHLVTDFQAPWPEDKTYDH